jgi:ubiquinone/menaquinone biosynthesis C-methylase UbiE
MLSLEEIRLLIEKLEKIKKHDLQELIDSNLKILRDLELAVDANNDEAIARIDKPEDWYRRDLAQKKITPVVDPWLQRMVETKIFQFSRTHLYNSLEIGPGTGMFSKNFRAWRMNYFLDVLPEVLRTVERRFQPSGKKHLRFFITRETNCENIPQGSCNFVFSWDTFVFFTKRHVQQYLHDIKRVLIPGGYVFIQYADCHYDEDLRQAQRKYWAYNTKTAMVKMIQEEGYEVVEMNQFKPGANYAIFRKPGKQNPMVYKVSEITLD